MTVKEIWVNKLPIRTKEGILKAQKNKVSVGYKNTPLNEFWTRE